MHTGHPVALLKVGSETQGMCVLFHAYFTVDPSTRLASQSRCGDETLVIRAISRCVDSAVMKEGRETCVKRKKVGGV